MPNPPPVPHGTLGQRLQCLLGLVVFLLIAYGIGRLRGSRAKVPARLLIWGVALQFIFAIIVLQVPHLLEWVNDTIQHLLDYTRDGASLVFGNLVDNAVKVVSATQPTQTIGVAQTSSIFAFFVLPTIIFFSALTAILYHLGIMQYAVQGLAWLMSKSMRTSGAETMSAAANIFVGQTEAPLMVKPFLALATRSELMCVMVGGFANIASGVLGLYTMWLKPFVENAGGHLAAACFISAPASLLISKLLVPEEEVAQTAGGVPFRVSRIDANVLDATTRGTFEGLILALNVGAMLIAFTAIVAMLNGLIAWTSVHLNLAAAADQPWTIQRLLGYPLSPAAWLTGIAPQDCRAVGSLLGVKTVLTELIAYQNMQASFGANANFLTPRDALLTTYALCGFANFASVGIQIGGISSMAPERRADLSRLALLAMLGGALASHTTACVVGILI